MKKICLILFAICVSVVMGAQGRQFTHINTLNSRLSSDCVKALLQDSRGYIWIGTVDGVNRYDGTRIRTYSASDMGLDSDFVNCMTEDINGDIWVATSSGVSHYDYRQDHFFPLRCATAQGESIDNNVNTMVSDPSGKMWFSVNKQGIFTYDIAKDRLAQLGLTFRRFAIAPDGRVWAGNYYKGLFVSDASVESLHPFNGNNDDFEGDQIQMLRFSASDPYLLYVSSLNWGLSTVDTRTGGVKHLCSLPRDAYLNDAFLEGERKWWAATTGGLYCYDLQKHTLESFVHTDDAFSISGNYAFCTITDSEGGLWVGTKDGGVDYSSPSQNRFRKVYTTDDGTPMQKYIVSGFAQTPDGTVWIATEQGGLLRYRDGAVSHVKPGLLPKTICSIVPDRGSLWIGTLTGLYRMDTATLALKSYGGLSSPDGLTEPRVYNVFKASDGNIYATTTRGLNRYNPASDMFTPLQCTGRLFYTDIKESSTGTLWLSSFYDGVFEIDPFADKIIASYGIEDGLDDTRVASMFLDRNNDVWAIGFDVGFARLDRKEGRFIPVNRSSQMSLDSDIFYSCVQDGEGRMWLTSATGLVLYYPESSGLSVFHLSDGLLDEKFTRGAFRSAEGELYFGSDNGFIVVDPASDITLKENPRLAITEMRVGNARVLPTPGSIIEDNIDIASKVHLRPGQNSFAFSFAAPGQYSKAPNISQYLLDPHSEDWRSIPQDGVVIFYNIPSGRYTLRVRTRNSEGKWVESHKPLPINVDKRFFESTAGIIVMLLAMMLTVGVVIFFVLRGAARRRREAEADYRKKKEEEMFYEKMNFFSHVIHEIKTPLTLIRTPLSEVLEKPGLPEDVSHDLEVVKNNTVYLSDLVSELLEYVRVERKGYTLAPIPLNLAERVEFLLFNYSDTARDKGLQITFEKPEDSIWVSADSSALNKILNNLLLNAVKYAESFIRIRLEEGEGEQAVLTIANDGPAIPAEQRDSIFRPFVRYSHSGSGFGIGLPLARSLAQMHSGSLELLDGEQETCFELILPQIPAPVQESDKGTGTTEPSGKPVILVVDDNEDMRAFLSRKFSDTYIIITAGSADAALKILRDRSIDLMITDITMPGMSGLDLCTAIRTDIEISHLPIIVLSARSSVESKIQAMEAGADLYVEKPFNMDFLRASISNILERRSLMRKALTGGAVTTDIKLFGLPTRDEEFLGKFDRLIMDNIGSSELSNTFLSENLAVSEATLIRKIRKLLDTTPVDYIRTKRLNIAAARLKAGADNISEVAWDLGFNSLSYFSKCFKDHFGCSPSDYPVMQKK